MVEQIAILNIYGWLNNEGGDNDFYVSSDSFLGMQSMFLQNMQCFLLIKIFLKLIEKAIGAV